MMKICFGDNVPSGVPDIMCNEPDPPDITKSKIISAIHVYSIIENYYISKNTTNDLLNRLKCLFDICISNVSWLLFLIAYLLQ